MDLVSLKARAEEIEKALLGLVSQHQTYSGQLAEVKHWIASLENPPAAAEEVPVVEGEVV